MKKENLSIKNFLVRTLRVSHTEAIDIVKNKLIHINGKIASLNDDVGGPDQVEYNGKVLKSPTPYIYLVYYKPRGIETTLNKSIKNNLKQVLPINENIFPIGRLDKESEGLLLLTNNGKIYNKIVGHNSCQEKEYLVKVNKLLTEEALTKLSSGVEILGTLTKPAQVKKLNDFEFNIILTQGLNRQIRRMCHKIGYAVIELKRIRIINIHLGNLQPGQFRNLQQAEINELLLSI